MANCRGLLVIGLFLAVLQVFFMQPTYCIDGIPANSSIPADSSKALMLTVAKEKGQGDFTTVQDAIDAVPVDNTNPVVINVKPGIYREKVNIPAEKPFITLTGSEASSSNTVITWNDSAKSSNGTYYSATVSVYASDFVARGITFENSHGPGNMTPGDQAVAVRISADRVAFYDCRFLGYQDTILDESGKHYFENCYIEGAIDVVCGDGKSMYKNCELHAIPIDNGAFTAQKRSSPSEDTGFVFWQCNLTGNGLMYLGRAWGPYSTVIFAETYMDDIIFPEGWGNWNVSGREETVTFTEFQNSGPGANYEKRVSWAGEVTDPAKVEPYLSMNYIDANTWVR